MREYKRWGIDVRLEEAGELPVGFNRGPWFGRLIGGDQAMDLHFVTPSYTSGTKGLQRGHVLIEPRTQEELDRMKHQLKGAWAKVVPAYKEAAITAAMHILFIMVFLFVSC